MVYDVTDRQSFNNLTRWMSDLKSFGTFDDVITILVGNKVLKKLILVLNTSPKFKPLKIS